MRAKVRVSLVPFLFLSVASVPLGEQVPPAPVQVLVGDVALAVAPGKQPFLENGVTMVPVQPLLQALGANVSSDGLVLSAAQGCRTISLMAGGQALQVDDEAHHMLAPARQVADELFAPLRTVAEALHAKVDWESADRTARVHPPAPQTQVERAAILTLQVRRAGTLTLPPPLREAASNPLRIGPGTHAWLLDQEMRTHTLTFTPDDGGRPQVLTATATRTSYRLSANTTDLTATLEILPDLSAVTTLALPAGFRSLPDLCRLPALRELKLTDGTDLTVAAGTERSERFPNRVETPNAVFLGDRGISMVMLARYAHVFETTTRPELERDTGLRPTTVKPVFLLYGDKEHWDAATGSSPYWGYYSAQEERIAMAHWKTPQSVNSLLLAHEFFHWLAWTEGHVNLPTWLNEGLAHNISWRVEQHADTWMSPFVRREWLRVANNTQLQVPDLSGHTQQDQFTITAVAHLLQTRGRDALIPFFALTREGTPYADAFAAAFGVSPAAYEGEYQGVVASIRHDH